MNTKMQEREDVSSIYLRKRGQLGTITAGANHPEPLTGGHHSAKRPHMAVGGGLYVGARKSNIVKEKRVKVTIEMKKSP